jgi:hypothetical protein
VTQSDLFRYLGAPLHNVRWSWGGVRSTDNTVVLRVWQDKKRRIDGKWYMELTDHRAYRGNESDAGFQERLKHVELIRSGTKTLMVMCLATDPAAQPRDIKSFDQRDVFVGGRLIQADDDWWLERVDRVAIQNARA